jgi:hypothetical protein
MNIERTRVSAAVLMLVAGLGAACAGPAPGTLEVRVHGEAFIEQGIPATAFSDGWAVRFDSFLVGLSDVSAAEGHGRPALSEPAPRVFELARPTDPPGTVVASAMVDGGRYDHVSYRIGPAVAGAGLGPGVDPAALAAMAAAGESVRVKGRAEKAGKAIAFAWGFTTSVLHRECHGRAKVDGGTAKTELTIHGDHLFHDDLFAEEPNLAFELIAAADSDRDGEVTRAELAAKDITREARYQVGSERITTLWDFIARQVTTIGHVDGEGHCETQLD